MHGDENVAATWENTGSLLPWGENPRKDQPIEAVAQSIRELGFGAPIVAQIRTRKIIAGHTRWFAAQKLGLPKVPVRFVDVDDRKAELMALADNKFSEKAKWDNPKLSHIAERHELEDLAIAGFSDDDLMSIIRAAEDTDIPPDDDEPPTTENETVETSFAVIIECKDEAQQVEVIELCNELELKCRALT